MKKILVVTTVALTLVATVLTGCTGKEPGAVTALVTTSANERYPVWSPDGSKIVYTSWKKSSMGVGETQEIGIWMMNADGSDRKLLTKVDTGFIEHMEWSPDGSKIAFVTYELSEGEPRDIYVIDVPTS